MLNLPVYHSNAEFLYSSAMNNWGYFDGFPPRFSTSSVYLLHESANAEFKRHLRRFKSSLKQAGKEYAPPKPHQVVQQQVKAKRLLAHLPEINYASVGCKVRDCQNFTLLTEENKFLNVCNWYEEFHVLRNPQRSVTVIHPGKCNDGAYSLGVEMVNLWKDGNFAFCGKFGLEQQKAIAGSDSSYPKNIDRLLNLDKCVETKKVVLSSNGIYAGFTVERHDCTTLAGGRDIILVYSVGYPEGYAYDAAFSLEEIIECLDHGPFDSQALKEALQPLA
jgi:hypothetical protein